MVDLLEVDSSMLASAGYDPERRTLVVLFNSGRAYEYYDVPAEVYQELLAADSKGGYMNENVIGTYAYGHFRGWKRE
jgi:hypothetical protein